MMADVAKPAIDSQPVATQHPRKFRRVSQACDYCHKRSIKCRNSLDGDGTRCRNCVDFGQACTYDRPKKRRGAKAHPQKPSDAGCETQQSWPKQESEIQKNCVHSIRQHGAIATSATASPASHPSNDSAFDTTFLKPWQAPPIASQALIIDLVEVYFEVVYPIFPIFHKPTFMWKIIRGEYLADRFLFASTMAACALASARARDGATISSRWSPTTLQEVSSETFYAAANSSIPVDIYTVRDFDAMRACALLAITSIQYGHIRMMHQHLGRYHALVAMDGLHDESNWPKDVGIVELEIRRRLFWAIYCLDVYASIVWSGVVRCREAHSDVLYPTEMDDETFDDTGFFDVPGTSPSAPKAIQPKSWLCGWNFTTDLYRVLEHAVDHFRTRRTRMQQKSFLHNIFEIDDSVSQAHVRDRVMDMYKNLPPQFKSTQPVTQDPKQDRFGFQAANIAATVQLLRMVLFSSGNNTVHERCQIASEVVDAFMTIPVGYLKAISSPLLHHLAGIGHILGAVFEEPLSQAAYQQVRIVLLRMAQLLEKLDIGLMSSAGVGERLRTHVMRIDEFWARQTQAHVQSLGIKYSPQHPHHQQQQQQQQQYVGQPHTHTHALPSNHQIGYVQRGRQSSLSGSPYNHNVHPNNASENQAESPGSASYVSSNADLSNNTNGSHSANGTGPRDGGGGNSNHVHTNNLRHGQVSGQFQLPPELYNDFPWGFGVEDDVEYPVMQAV